MFALVAVVELSERELMVVAVASVVVLVVPVLVSWTLSKVVCPSVIEVL